VTGRKLTICTAVVLGFSAATLLRAETTASRKGLLRDGFVVSRIDGVLKSQDSNDAHLRQWVFELAGEVSDGKALVTAGTRIELLPSAALERMAADVRKRTQANYRLWARVTEYRGRNYLYPTYFLPLSKVAEPNTAEPSVREEPNSQAAEPLQSQPRPVINEPNDILTLPPEIVAKLDSEEVAGSVRRETSEPAGVTRHEAVFLDRAGFLHGSGRESVFVPDAYGWSRPQLQFHLLPCKTLERAENAQSSVPQTVRFKVAGITTHYQDAQYLLLQKVTRLYSHGNFDR
jgi:hypothetical protein